MSADSTSEITPGTTLGAVLAGGAGRRMGGRDKGALMLGGEALGPRAVTALQACTGEVIVVGDTAPGWLKDKSLFQADYALDAQLQDRPGPVAGLLAALAYAEEAAGPEGPENFVFTTPVDAPFWPSDLPQQLAQALGAHAGAIARHGDGLHPVFGLWRARAFAPMLRLVREEGERALHRIAAQLGAAIVDIFGPEHAFLNINTPEDLAAAETRIAATKA